MNCRNCGAELNEKQAVCLQCGVKVGDGNQFCPNCGSAVAENAEVCLNCGVALKQEETPKPLNGQDKLVMILLAILLSGFGIHNFLMGEVKKGVFRIVMSFVCSIGNILSIVDAIKIATDTYVVDPDKLV